MNSHPRSVPMFALVLAGAVSAQDPIAVQVDQAPGAKVHYRVQTVLEQAIDMGGQTMDMGNDSTQVLEFEVKERNADGALSVVVRVLRTSGTMTLPMMGDVEFDSAAKVVEAEAEVDDFGAPTDAIKQALTALAGQEFTATVTPAGKVGKIDGISAFVDAARAKAGQMGAQMLGGVINEGAVRQMLEGAFVELPKDSVAGKPWKVDGTREGSRGMKMLIDGTMVIEGADAKEVIVSGQGTLRMAPAEKAEASQGDDGEDDGESAGIRAMLAKMKIENATTSSKSTVSRQDGMVLKNRLEMAMDLTMPSPMGGGDMTIEQRTVTTVTRVSAEEANPKKADKDK